MRLIDRRPHHRAESLDAHMLVERFHPPKRFADVRFETYRPDEKHPSQTKALRDLQHFVASIEATPAKQSRWRPQRRALRTPKALTKSGLYLDGGFGVGKTHLLSSVWFATTASKSYLAFTELTAFIGLVGMSSAVAAFSRNQLICIDEFELDDVANTLMVVSFLRGVMDAAGSHVRVVVTSNTIPERLGEERFSASEFKREIAAIASHFGEVRIDGDDFRVTTHQGIVPTTLAPARPDTVTEDDFASLLSHLHQVHPAYYGTLLDDVDGVIIRNLATISDQEDALLFVQLVDKLYDARIPVLITGCAIEDAFSESYRNGGYRKKYGRATSRMQAMQSESSGLLGP